MDSEEFVEASWRIHMLLLSFDPLVWNNSVQVSLDSDYNETFIVLKKKKNTKFDYLNTNWVASILPFSQICNWLNFISTKHGVPLQRYSSFILLSYWCEISQQCMDVKSSNLEA